MPLPNYELITPTTLKKAVSSLMNLSAHCSVLSRNSRLVGPTQPPLHVRTSVNNSQQPVLLPATFTGRDAARNEAQADNLRKKDFSRPPQNQAWHSSGDLLSALGHRDSDGNSIRLTITGSFFSHRSVPTAREQSNQGHPRAEIERQAVPLSVR